MPRPIGATPVFSPQRVEAPPRSNAAPRPYDDQGRLSSAALEWIEAQALKPSYSGCWASRLVSTGLYAYLNFRDAPEADRHFEQLRLGMQYGQADGPSLDSLIRGLDERGFLPHVDVFVPPSNHDPRWSSLLYLHSRLENQLVLGTDQHPLGDGSALRDRLEALPPGQCMMLSLDTRKTIAVMRDSEQFWVFDVTLNPSEWEAQKERVEPYRYVQGAVGGKYSKCVNGDEARSLLDAYLASARKHPVLVSPPSLAAGPAGAARQ